MTLTNRIKLVGCVALVGRWKMHTEF